jgi:hypothetical protein
MDAIWSRRVPKPTNHWHSIRTTKLGPNAPEIGGRGRHLRQLLAIPQHDSPQRRVIQFRSGWAVARAKQLRTRGQPQERLNSPLFLSPHCRGRSLDDGDVLY